MDGLRGVWHGGPFARTTRYVFYPRQIMFGTDPVAIDRLLLDIIEDKRRAEGRDLDLGPLAGVAKIDDARARDADPNVNIIIREPGHVEYASTLGLGVYDRAQDHGAGRHRMTPLAAGGARVAAVRLLDAGHREPRRRSKPRASSASASRRSRSTPGGPQGSRSARSPRRSSPRAKRCPFLASPRAPGLASPTRSPWIVANGWRFARQPRPKFVYDLPAGKGGARRRRGLRLRRRRRPEDRSRGSRQRSERC